MVCKLNLRRNKIGNRGAQLLADFIRHGDGEIYSLNLERNRVTAAGGQALLEAMRETVRLLDLKVTYGNQLSRSLEFSMQAEERAN